MDVLMPAWYTMTPDAALRELRVDAHQGLSEDEAARRLARHGPNRLVERSLRSPWRILADQLRGVMTLILVAAAIISGLLGDYKDTIVILAIVLLNVALGYSQESRAEHAMAALKRMATPGVRVRRGGHEHMIPSPTLVPGDIIVLEVGTIVPADGRLLDARTLRTQEAALTGESAPVEKRVAAIIGADVPIGDRYDIVHMGTTVTYGRGTAVVTETGMRTELGRVAELLQDVESEATPLQRRLDDVGKWLALLALPLILVIVGLGLLRGENLKLLLLTGVSVAVAAIPEGLPAIVTISLALSAQRMLKRQALIRKLPAVETLGSVTVICTDKTGTLTQNRMTVATLDIPSERPPDGPRAGDVLSAEDTMTSPASAVTPEMRLLLLGAALCNDAHLEPSTKGGDEVEIMGDPTEGALVEAAAQQGLGKRMLEAVLPRVGEAPFDSERKRMTTLHRLPPAREDVAELVAEPLGILRGTGTAKYIAFTKGAVDGVLAISGRIWTSDGLKELDDRGRQRIEASNVALAGQGLRVLALAFRPLDAREAVREADQLERDLTFLGLIGMIDPPRLEVKAAVRTCARAGITIVMITGDHSMTALAIARELALPAAEHVLTGQELTEMSADELERRVNTTRVYARVNPEHKLAIVRALQQQGQIVAMTGDGVNDAPALKQADIGVAMGVTGTDVARETADMVLLDDNFGTIVAAVEEGRTIYDNIRKFLRYLLTTNSAEVWVMLLAPIVGMPLPLLPLQILWMNLVTDGLPALALSVEPAERQVMRRPPRAPSESLFARGLGWKIVWVGLLMSLLVLGLGFWLWSSGDPRWRTIIFTTLTFAQMANVLAIRSERDLLFQVGPLSNKPLLGAVALTVALQLAVVYVPFLQGIFSTQPLTWSELALTAALSAVVFLAVEAEKLALRRRQADA
jgi:Ca2+-transporting ATPase